MSDTEPGPNTTVAAATVVFGNKPNDPFELVYSGLSPGSSERQRLSITYEGSVPASVTLEIHSDSSSDFCPQGEPIQPGNLLIKVGDNPQRPYCSLLGEESVDLGEFAPDESSVIPIEVELARDAGANYSGLSDSGLDNLGGLQLVASNGFSDKILGTLSISTAEFDEVPDPCSGMGFVNDDVIRLGNGKQTWKPSGDGEGPFIVVGGRGKDMIVGSDGADCLIGGAGKDTLRGRGGDDVLIGRPIDKKTGDKDTCIGGPGSDRLYSCETTGESPKKLSEGESAQERRQVQRQEPSVVEQQRSTVGATESHEASIPVSRNIPTPSERTARPEAPSQETSSLAPQETSSPQPTDSEAPDMEEEGADTPTSSSEPSTSS